MEDPWSPLLALADDRTLGATETTEQAAGALARIPPDDLADAVETLLRAHPGMAPLWRLADILLSRNPAVTVERFVSDLGDHELAAVVAAPVLPSTLLTISCSAAVKEAIRIRKPSTVLCMVSEPGAEGYQMAGLASAWSDAVVIADEKAIAEVPADAVVVGADAITPTAVINKVKTLALVQAARERGIPAYAMAGTSKLVPFELPVVEPFEATPIELFEQIGAPGGMLAPGAAAARAASVKVHPALEMLADKLKQELARPPDAREDGEADADTAPPQAGPAATAGG
jgi:translation initiation factor 2B subunit (eIF-2B alpha/beta/delta family)